MPKTQRLEHGERRRCLVAPRRAKGRQTRYTVLGRRRAHGRAHSLTQILSSGGTKPWQGPDGVYGDIVAPDTPVSGMITCGTGSPLAGGSGAKVLARGRERGSDLLAEGA
jgi:ribosomal protein L34